MARTGVHYKSEKIGEARLRWLGHVREKDRGRCSHENTEDGSEWTRKDRKAKTEVEQCHTKTSIRKRCREEEAQN